ncbi:hypothetical protein JCM11641_007057 [Rhodosporidiobolus odoratus]
MEDELEPPKEQVLSTNVRDAWKLCRRSDAAESIAFIRKHIRDNYTKWTALQQWQAAQIINHIKWLQLKAHYQHDVPPLEASEANVRSIINRISVHDRDNWADTIQAWIKRRWDNVSEYHRQELVKALHTIEATMVQKRSKKLVTTDTMIKVLEAALLKPEVDQRRTSNPHDNDDDDTAHLLDLSPGLYGNIPRVQDPPHPPHPPRDHQLRAIGHRAAKHYGTTKARWEAGHRW